MFFVVLAGTSGKQFIGTSEIAAKSLSWLSVSTAKR